MKYKLSGIIDAELTTLGQARPGFIKPLIDAGCTELAAEMSADPVYVIKGNGRFYKSYILGPYIRPADTALERMRIELDDLTEKLVKLEIFLRTPKFLSLDKEMRDLLHDQLKVMKEYKEILEKRIELMQK